PWREELEIVRQKADQWDRKTIFWREDEPFQVECIYKAILSAPNGKNNLPRRWLYHVKWFNWPEDCNSFEPGKELQRSKFDILGRFWRSTDLGMSFEPPPRKYKVGEEFRSSDEYRKKSIPLAIKLWKKQNGYADDGDDEYTGGQTGNGDTEGPQDFE
ncbi:hypothetical protein CPB86DRAFT_820610, partial [Serendipita vermifera]